MNARVKHSWTPRRSLRSLLGGLALAVALLGGVGIPMGYALVEYVERTRLLSFKAELNANRLAKYIYSHEQLWQYQRERLGEIIELPRDAHPFFIACQFHPEYKSKPLAVHPLFDSFVRAAWDNRIRSENLEHDVTAERAIDLPEKAEVAAE